MHQINGAVGLEQIAPGAPAGMGFSTDQQHTQTIPHAVHLDQGGIVAVSQFPIRHGDRKAYHITPAMRQRKGQIDVFANGYTEALRTPAVN